MQMAYTALHRAGCAFVEAWEDEKLAGGLYGVSVGRAFFGESMFTLSPNASKVAFVTLVKYLKTYDFHLIDCRCPRIISSDSAPEKFPESNFSTYSGAAWSMNRYGESGITARSLFENSGSGSITSYVEGYAIIVTNFVAEPQGRCFNYLFKKLTVPVNVPFSVSVIFYTGFLHWPQTEYLNALVLCHERYLTLRHIRRRPGQTRPCSLCVP